MPITSENYFNFSPKTSREIKEGLSQAQETPPYSEQVKNILTNAEKYALRLQEGISNVKKVLLEYGRSDEEVEVITTMLGNRECFVLSYDDGYPIIGFKHRQPTLPNLPQGYAIIGGAARTTVLEELQGIHSAVRDIDLAAIDILEPDMDLYDAASQHFMPDDYAHGYGASYDKEASYEEGELMPLTVRDYMKTRDFRLNEILISGELVLIKPLALLDLHNRRIVPAEYEMFQFESHHYDTYGIYPKLALKALRLAEALKHELGQEVTIENVDDWQFTFEGVTLVALAINIEKAMAANDIIASGFYAALLNKGIITPLASEYRSGVEGDSLGEIALNITLSLSKWSFNDPALAIAESAAHYSFQNPSSGPIAQESYYQDLADGALSRNHKLGRNFEAQVARRTLSLYQYIISHEGNRGRPVDKRSLGRKEDIEPSSWWGISPVEWALRKAMGELPTVAEIEKRWFHDDSSEN